MRVYDLYCGLGGWAEGFLAEGYEVTGFDLEAHDYGTGGYPGTLVLRDVRSIHGSELKDATCIVGSSPCQEFSYRAMPWKRAKALPPPYLGIELFNAQFRIQREASEAAGHHIPMVVENVRGAQKWVGRAQAHFGSFYLWGDVGMVGNRVVPIVNGRLAAAISARKESKNNGGSWFNIGSPGQRDTNQNPVHQLAAVKVPGINWSDRRRPAQGFNVVAAQRYREGVKFSQSGDARFDGKPRDKMLGDKGPAAYGSRSDSRKAASAMIAKIPYPLAVHIAKCFKPGVTP